MNRFYPRFELVALDVCTKEPIAHFLCFDTRERRALTQTPKDDESHRTHAAPEIETRGCPRRLPESIPGRGRVIDPVTVPFHPLENAERTRKAADKNRKAQFVFKGGFPVGKVFVESTQGKRRACLLHPRLAPKRIHPRKRRAWLPP